VEDWRFERSGCFTEYFRRTGFAVVEGVLEPEFVDRLTSALASAVGPEGYAKRNLLTAVPLVMELARSDSLLNLVEPFLGPGAFPVKGILFDKTPGANWKVAWHQDTMISVRERRDTPGFGPWSVKEGVVHVQPPGLILSDLLTVRVHLDDCGPENGPLRVMPGSHTCGVLGAEAIDGWRETHQAVVCTVARGGVLLMRPLTLHASSAAETPGHRRVVHLEYAAAGLPNGLHWASY